MARVWAELTPEELLALGQLEGISNNTVIYKDNSGVIQALSLGASGTVLTSGGPTSAPTFSTNGVGDVVGPASSTDNNVVFFDGITGKLIKDSGLALSGSNTGDQTSMSGISDTKANFDTACSDGNFVYTGDTVTNLVMSTAKLLGRNTASTGVVEEITLGTGLSFSGTTLNATSGGNGPIISGYIAGEITVGTIFRMPVSKTITAGTFRVSLEVLPTGADVIVKLYKNDVEDASVTIATTDSATNGIYQGTDATFVSGSYVATDVLKVSITQIGSTLSGSGLAFSLVE